MKQKHIKFFKKHSKLILSVFFCLFYVVFWQIAVDVKNTIRIDELKKDVETKKDAEYIKKIDANLIIDTPVFKEIYKRDAWNNDSLWDLIEELRQEGKFTYEQTEFVNGPKITNINGIENNSGWTFYKDGKKLDENFKNHRIVDDAIYTLK